MNEKTTYPRLTVTVLRDAVPILVSDIQQTTENSEAIELFYPTPDVLREAVEALNSAFNGVQYQLWLDTGVMPVPRDYVHPEKPEPPPF